jgi:hypothetical protein
MDGCVVLESVAGHEHHADGVSGLDEGPCFICRGCHRFFDKYMLARGDCLQAKLCMAGWRCGDYERINMRQGILNVGVYANAVIDLLLSAIDLGKPLVHADDCRYPGRGPQHAYVPRTPITYSNDADANSVWLHSNLSPLVSVLRLRSFSAALPIFGTLPISAWSGIPA